MKQRFSSLDVKVIAHELANTLIPLRVSNVYDLSSKIFLIKFARPGIKEQIVIDSGFRCHLTQYSRVTAAAPSPFVARLRKVLKTRRVTSISQIGTDRIIEFQFSDGQYRIYLEFYAGGNIILTDKELKILALLRIVPAGDGQEELRVGLTYSLANRQNFNGTPELTIERLREALVRATEKDDVNISSGKKSRNKGGDGLRKALAVSITEYPPMLLDHAMKATGFDSLCKAAEVLQTPALLDALLQSLEEAKKVVQQITSSQTTKGYIVAKHRAALEPSEDQTNDPSKLLYDEFHPFRPRQFENDTTLEFLEFDGFNKAVDEFFSSIEGQKLESRLEERELHAKRKLAAAHKEHAKRLGGLQSEQGLNENKAAAIIANVQRVQEAMDAVNGLIAQGMDWLKIGKLIEVQQKRHNPVALLIRLPLKLDENTVTLILDEEDFDDNDSAYQTDTDMSNDESETKLEVEKRIEKEAALAIDINLSITPWANAREYYDYKRSASKKEEKTLKASTIALKNTEQKITRDLKKGLKQEKALLRPIRRQIWFEKFTWFISSDGYLVLAGKDAQQNEILYRKYLKKGDVYVHADLQGAAIAIIRNNPSTPNAPLPPSTLSQAGTLAVACSTAWDSKAGMSAWWVNADQVSKSAPGGEFLPPGRFTITGQKNFLPPAQLLLGFGAMFLISEESKARHVKHRFTDAIDDGSALATAILEPRSVQEEPITKLDDECSNDGDDPRDMHDDESSNDINPLQPLELAREPDEAEDVGASSMQNLTVEGDEEPAVEDCAPTSSDELIAQSSVTSEPQSSRKKSEPLKRGKRGKAKKIAQKYKDQDEEDRIAAQQLIGSTVGVERSNAEAEAKAKRETELLFHKERRRAQHAKSQKETAEHEEARKQMLEQDASIVEDEEEDEEEKLTAFDALVGTPLPGDEILHAVPVCAPWTAMNKLKYKAKLQPGTVKKGKAVREILTRWSLDSAGKGKIDETSTDTERMWPREVELLKTWKPEEITNTVPVGKVRIMMSGGTTGQGSSSKQGKGGKKGR